MLARQRYVPNLARNGVVVYGFNEIVLVMNFHLFRTDEVVNSMIYKWFDFCFAGNSRRSTN